MPHEPYDFAILTAPAWIAIQSSRRAIDRADVRILASRERLARCHARLDALSVRRENRL